MDLILEDNILDCVPGNCQSHVPQHQGVHSLLIPGSHISLKAPSIPIR